MIGLENRTLDMVHRNMSVECLEESRSYETGFLLEAVSGAFINSTLLFSPALHGTSSLSWRAERLRNDI